MNIGFIGNSVIAQRHSYRGRLIEYFRQDGSEPCFVNCCLGGIGSLGIGFFVDFLAKGRRFDLVFLETFVADLGGATPRQLIAPALKGLLKNPRLSMVRVVPLLLYRSDIDSRDYQAVLQIYKQVFATHGLSAIDIYSEVSDLVQAGMINQADVVYDAVYTLPKGFDLYAAVIWRNWQNIAALPNEATQFDVSVDAIAAAPLFLMPQYIEAGCYETGHYRLVLPYVLVCVNNYVEFKVPSLSCIGLIVITDVDSGVVSIRSDGFSDEAQIFDQWCHRQRLQVVLFPQSIVHNQTIHVQSSAKAHAKYAANLALSGLHHVAQILKIVSLMLTPYTVSRGNQECL
jgi:hypothetical protein